MKLHEALKKINEDKSNFIYNVYVPSLNRDVLFRSISVGEIKNFARLLISDTTDNLLYSTTTLIQILMVEELDVLTFNELDRLTILFQLKLINKLGDDNYNIKCGHCENAFIYNYDLNECITQIKTIYHKNKEHEFEFAGSKYKLIINLPSLSDCMGYHEFSQKFAKEIEEKDNISDDDKLLTAAFLLRYLRILYVRGIHLNDTEISDFYESSLVDRITFLENLPGMVMGQIDNILTTYKKEYDLISLTAVNLNCPLCSKKLIMRIDPKDFFIS